MVAVQDGVEEVGAAVDEVSLRRELDAQPGSELVGGGLRQVLDPAPLDLAYGERAVGVDERVVETPLGEGGIRTCAAAPPR